uniref:Posterior neuron-specific homeobox n=1 Tax=Sinocyclocheilus anshuiensis TaxID=1608454 RepID=A0A671MHU6_9TELE
MNEETGSSPVQGKTSFSIVDILDPSKFTGKHQETQRDIRTAKTASSQDAADSNIPKSKRMRTAFTLDQLRILERSFQNSHYLSVFERHCIATGLRLSETQVKIWCTKWKKEEEGHGGEEQNHCAHRAFMYALPGHHANPVHYYTPQTPYQHH